MSRCQNIITYKKQRVGGRIVDGEKNRKGFTLVELLVVIAIIGMLMALLLPAIQAARELARRMQCSNHLKQITLSALTFHDTHNRYPASVDDSILMGYDNRRESGFFVLLLPFLEQESLFHNLMGEGSSALSGQNYQLALFLCPSDSSGSTRRASDVRQVASNYRACRGDLSGDDVQDVDWPGCDECGIEPDLGRKHFNMPRSWVRSMNHVGDNRIVSSGTSNTIAFSEGLIGSEGSSQTYKDTAATIAGSGYHFSDDPQVCYNIKGPSGFFREGTGSQSNRGHFLGKRIWSNAPLAYAFYALLPPNSPSCYDGGAATTTGWVSASSAHRGGVNVSFLDGSVRFIPESVDRRNLERPGGAAIKRCEHLEPVYATPPDYPDDGSGRFSYGVWAELGAVNSVETIPSL